MAATSWDKIVADLTALARWPESAKQVLRDAGPPLSDELEASEMNLELFRDELPKNLKEVDQERVDEGMRKSRRDDSESSSSESTEADPE